ncbi:hypothetical protein F8M41_008849 [Gigaspora margarita]|uniref:Uncharacterized protein n=1 Tax=Gigaspora margarita TaxID=4874 RepID=A0A8H4AVG3_GIGMA|nr:hypothetical protein F8M41_008849 [Gigaspora margarita]
MITTMKTLTTTMITTIPTTMITATAKKATSEMPLHTAKNVLPNINKFGVVLNLIVIAFHRVKFKTIFCIFTLVHFAKKKS